MTDRPNCTRIRTALAAVLTGDGGESAVPTADLERHLTSCADCREARERMRHAAETVRRAATATPRAGRRRAVLDALGDGVASGPPAGGVPSRPGGGWAVAAAVVLLAASGLLVRERMHADRLRRARDLTETAERERRSADTARARWETAATLLAEHLDGTAGDARPLVDSAHEWGSGGGPGSHTGGSPPRGFGGQGGGPGEGALPPARGGNDEGSAGGAPGGRPSGLGGPGSSPLENLAALQDRLGFPLWIPDPAADWLLVRAVAGPDGAGVLSFRDAEGDRRLTLRIHPSGREPSVPEIVSGLPVRAWTVVCGDQPVVGILTGSVETGAGGVGATHASPLHHASPPPVALQELSRLLR